MDDQKNIEFEEALKAFRKEAVFSSKEFDMGGGYTIFDNEKEALTNFWNAAVASASNIHKTHVTVPKEITYEMQRAYFDVIDKNLSRVETDATFGRYESQKEAYRAMLSAAPKIT